MPADPKDSVPSPTPAPAPSPSASPAPAATPEPTNGVPAAPPAASDKASAPAVPAVPADGRDGEKPGSPDIKPLGDGDVLDRLTAPTEDKTKTPTEPAKAPVAEPKDDAENPAAPPEPKEGEAEPEFKDATDEELAGYHSRTRHRIKGFQKQLDYARPRAQVMDQILGAAQQAGVSLKGVLSWQNLGFGLKARDPEALEALAGLLKSNGYELPAPAAPPAPDTQPLELAVAELFSSQEISEVAKLKLAQAIGGFKKPAAQPQAQPAPTPQPQARPIQAQPQASPLAETQAWIDRAAGAYERRFGANWQAIERAALAEATRREAQLDPRQVMDPVELKTRYAACVEWAAARHQSSPSPVAAAKPAAPPIQPTLRAHNGTPPPPAIPKRGTPEYDDYVMTHGVPT